MDKGETPTIVPANTSKPRIAESFDYVCSPASTGWIEKSRDLIDVGFESKIGGLIHFSGNDTGAFTDFRGG